MVQRWEHRKRYSGRKSVALILRETLPGASKSARYPPTILNDFPEDFWPAIASGLPVTRRGFRIFILFRFGSRGFGLGLVLVALVNRFDSVGNFRAGAVKCRLKLHSDGYRAALQVFTRLQYLRWNRY